MWTRDRAGGRNRSDRRFRGLSGRGVVIAVVAPAAAGVASIPLARNGPAAAIALFLLAIVIAAVAGGLWAGLLAAVLSSIGLPFLYGAPAVPSCASTAPRRS